MSMKRPSSLKRPAAGGAINDAIKRLKSGVIKDPDEKKEEQKVDEEQENEGEDHRDKAKGQKYAKLKDSLPDYIVDLVEVQSKKSVSPRDFKTKVINKLFTKGPNGKLELNLGDMMFEEHKRIFTKKYHGEEDAAMPESILKGLYFGNDKEAFENAKKNGDIQEVDVDGKSFWAFKTYKKGIVTGTTDEQSLKGNQKIDRQQSKLLKEVFNSVGWDWNYVEADVKKMITDHKIPSAVLHLVKQASDSQSKLAKEAMTLIKSWPDAKDTRLKELKTGYAETQLNLTKLTHMKEFCELPGDEEPTKANLDKLMQQMAQHVQRFNELVETCRGVMRSKKNWCTLKWVHLFCIKGGTTVQFCGFRLLLELGMLQQSHLQ